MCSRDLNATRAKGEMTEYSRCHLWRMPVHETKPKPTTTVQAVEPNKINCSIPGRRASMRVQDRLSSPDDATRFERQILNAGLFITCMFPLIKYFQWQASTIPCSKTRSESANEDSKSPCQVWKSRTGYRNSYSSWFVVLALDQLGNIFFLRLRCSPFLI